jgi:chloramphenicol 3-O phosphotransferase
VIVLLNGTSSSGKTTLAGALQRALPEPYLRLGIDTVVFALPGRWLDAPLWHEVFVYRGADPDLRITAGPLGDKLVATLHRMVAVAAAADWGVLVDHVLLDRRWVADAADVLGQHGLLSVGVRCPLEEVVRRERQRRDRTVGQARAQFDVVHAHMRYDVEVDTSAGDTDACAAQIVAAMLRHDGRSVLAGPDIETYGA